MTAVRKIRGRRVARSASFGLLAAVALLAVFAFPATASADPGGATIVVTTTADDDTAQSGQCTLRDAIAAANTDAVVGSCIAGVQSATNTIELQQPGDYDIGCGPGLSDFAPASDMNILGQGARNTQITANCANRVMRVVSGNVTLDGVEITGGTSYIGDPDGNAGDGGGIYVDSGASLTLQDSWVYGNTAQVAGGGIYNAGSLTVVRSTLESNYGQGAVGGGIADFGTSLSITNSTIYNNTGEGGGGGLYLDGNGATLLNDTIAKNSSMSGAGAGIAVNGIDPHTVFLTNTLLANNNENSTPSDCSTPIASLGGNLDDDGTCGLSAGDQSDVTTGVGLGTPNINLPIDVLPLQTGSPAIDKGNTMGCPRTDELLVARPQGSGCDIGAYEYTDPSTPPADYYVSTVDELDAATSEAETFYEAPATIHIAGGHYDIGNLDGTIQTGEGLTFAGAGAANTVLDGDGVANRVFDIGGSATTAIKGVTVKNSSGDGIYDNGAVELGDSVVQDNGSWGIESVNAGLDVSGSTIAGNGGTSTGGIYVESSFSAVNTTVADNNGLGVDLDYVDSGANLENVTIAGNYGPGIDLGAGPTTMVNSIVANNTQGDCAVSSGTFTSNGHNIASDGSCPFTDQTDSQADPKLGPLQDNGGPTPTMALAPGSPAVNAGDDSSCPAVDQRGITRPQGSHCDVGAFELVPGSIAFESNRTGNSQIWTMSPDGSNVTQLTHDASSVTDTLPSISPDGHTVVYQSTSGGFSQIWAINGNGTDPRQLTSVGSNEQPTFSPDGKKIAFDSNRLGYNELFVMNADGSGQTKVMDTDGAVEGSSWSPDGSQIAFSEDTNGTDEIYTVDVASGIVTGPLTTAATDGANTNPHWSPDGSEILFVSNRCDPGGLAESPLCGGGESVFLMNADGTNQYNLTQAPIFDADPAWSPDGKQIAFTRDLGGQNFNVFTANADGTNQVQLTFGSAPSRNSFPNWGTQVSGASFVVSTAADSDDGSCTASLCSLRDAINAANAAPGSGITFDIPGGGLPTITLALGNLPPITAPVTIDGTTQPGAPPGKPGVTLAVNNGFAGPQLEPGSDGSTIRGLAIGGANDEAHQHGAIDVASNNDTIENDYIGVSADGSSGNHNSLGIVVTGNNDTIGGDSSAGDGNVIVRSDTGILVENGATGTVIQGNQFGIYPDGSLPLGSTDATAIDLEGAANTVVGNNDGPGGLGDVKSHPELGNVIAGSSDAIDIASSSAGSVVAGNFLGVDRTQSPTDANNEGIDVAGSSGNQIGPGNVVANSSSDGVLVDASLNPANGDRIVANSIYGSGNGIDLRSDAYSANDGIAAPAVTSVVGTTASGTVTGNPGDSIFIELFGNPSCDNTTNGAGRDYLSFAQATIGPSGTATWTASGLPLGNDQGVTATATNQSDDTSQFSTCATVGGDGTLSGSVSASGQQNANLTSLGTQDWAVWGYANNGTSTSLSPDMRKAGGSGISDLSDIHQNGAPLRGIGQFAGSLPYSFDWSDGTVPTSATGTALGLQHDGQPGTVGANGDGFSFTVPADTTQRTLTVYTSAHWATGTLTATLSDGSAQPYTQNVTGTSSPDEGNAPGVFTIDYAAASAGQHLTVTWVETAGTCPSFGCDNAAIYAVALSGTSSSATGASATFSASGPVAISGTVPISNIPLAAFDPQPPGAPPITIQNAQLGHTQLGQTQLGHTQLGHTQLGQTQLGHTQLGQTQLGQTQLGHTQLGHTQLGQTQLGQTQLGQTQLGHTQLGQTQLGHTQLAQTGLTLNLVPLGDPTEYPNGWTDVLQGTSLAGQPLQTITLDDVYSPSLTGTADALARIQNLTFADVDLPDSTLGQVTMDALTLGPSLINQLGGSLQNQIESQLDSWCMSIVPAGDPGNFCTGSDPGIGYFSLLQLGLIGAPVDTLQLGQTQLGQTQLGHTQLGQTQLGQTQLDNLSGSASGIVGMQLGQTDLTTPGGIGGLLVGSLPNVNALFDCTNPTNFDCGTGTLAQAQAAGAIKPGTLVGDLDQGNFFQGVTIEELLNTIRGSNSDYANLVTFGDVVGLLIRSTDVSWESLSPDLLTIFDPNRNQLPMTAGFTVQGTGSPAADVRIDLPAGFDYKAGSATLSENGGSGTPLSDPTVTSISADSYALDWHLDSVDAGQPYTISYDAFAGTTVGPTQATETVSAGGSSSSSIASFTVTDSFPDSNSAPDATPIDTTPGHETVEMSALPTAGAVDYYTIPMPPAGTRISAHLTDLPADYDLALYSPQTTSVRTTSNLAPPLQDGVVPDTQVNLTGGSSGQLTPTGLEDVPDPGIPLVQLSDNRHQDDEDVGMVSPGGSGVVTIAVFGYNGAFSPDAYTLRVRESAPPATQICPARVLPDAGQGSTPDSLPGLSSLPSNLNTIILVNELRLGNTYGSTDEANAVAKLHSLAGDGSLGVSGTVVPVETIPGVQSLYDTWDSNPCDPGSANAVANAIADEVDAIVAQRPSVKYVVFAGGDDQIPFFRLPDLSLIANENGFTGLGANEYGASLAAGDLLSDDPYLDTQPVPAGGQQLFPPNLSGGRLVETAQDITNAVTSFESSSGALKSSTGFVSGYDFVADGSQSVASNLTANGVNVRSTLIDPLGAATSSLFGTSDLLNAAFPPNGTGTPADINSWNGHYDNYRAQMANGDIISTSDVPSGLNGGIFFTMGCHAGFQTTDAAVGTSVLDWPQYFAQHDTGFVGNTGFGLGETDSVAFSEELMADFAGQLTSTSTLGNALTQAKQQYYLSRVAFSNYDEKALSEAELYGLPMYGIGHSPASLAAPTDPPVDPVHGASASTSPSQGSLSSFPGSGVQSANFDVTPSFGVEQHGMNGDFFTNGGQVQAPNYRPLQPYLSLPAGRSGSPGLYAHGVVVDSLTSQDHTGFTPDNVRPTLNSSANEPPPTFSDESWPEKIPTLVSLGQDQNLNLATGQFFTQSTGGGVERLWTQIDGRVTYSTSQDYTPPTIDSIDAFESDPGQSDDILGFSGRFSDLDQNGDPGTVVFAQVVYDDGTGHWQAVQLQQDTTSGLWSAGVPFAGSHVQYFVEACDAAGNCGYSSNKGNYFDAQALPSGTGSGGTAGTLTISPDRAPDAGSWYDGGLTVNAASTAPDATVSVTVDGVAQPPGPVSLHGDGAHVVVARDSAGNVATAIYLVDTTGPTITPTTSPAAPDGTNGWYKTQPTITFNCSDNLSGVASCLADGGPGNKVTLGDGASPQSATGTATDSAGNASGPDTVSGIKVDSSAPALSVTPSASDAFDYVNGSTVYYNPSGANTGSFTITAATSDAQSGVDHVAFPNLFTGSDGGNKTTSPYADTYTWHGGATASGTKTVSSFNVAGLNTDKTFTVTPDTTAPTGGSVTYSGGYNTTGTVPVSFTPATDSGSGIATNVLQSQYGTLLNGNCTFSGTWAPVTLTGGHDTVTNGHCAEYRLLATDKVSNQGTFDPGIVVKVDTTPPTGGTISVTAGYNNTGTVPVTVANATDPESGMASNQVQRKLAPLSAGTCGTFAATWSIVTLSSGNDTVPTGQCAMYQLVATDNAGLFVTRGPTGMVKVDTSPPSTPTFSGIQAISYKPSALPPQSAISCSSTDPDSGIASCVVTGYSVALGQHILTATATNNAGKTSTNTLTYTVAKLNPNITWNAPATMLFGVPLSSTQLNATADVPGSFVYAPPAGTVLQPGPQVLNLTFTPTNTTDYNTIGASHAITVGFSQTCQTGSVSGSITVKSGNAYCIQGGKVSGSITVQSGGSLYITGGTVSGSITATGATGVTLCGTTVSNSTSIGTSTGPVMLGGPTGSGCAGNKLSGSLTLTGNKGALTVDGNTISGAVTASSNTGGFVFSANKVSGAVTVNGNSGGVTFTNNTVSGNVTITNNTGGFMYSGNTVSGTVTLKNNN